MQPRTIPEEPIDQMHLKADDRLHTRIGTWSGPDQTELESQQLLTMTRRIGER